MTPAISVSNLTRRFGRKRALDGVTFDVAQGSIVGLVGRNGSGKTTLLRIIAAQEFASGGSVRVLGENPVENAAILNRMVLIREDQRYPGDYFRVLHALDGARSLCRNWSDDLAETLRKDFDLPLETHVRDLSRGMRAALGIIIGLASRADVTLFDEPYAGLDAVARGMFYDRLLADLAEHPRTVLLATHLIDEVAGLLERVVVLDHGKVVLEAATDDLRGSATRVSGPATAVEGFAAGRPTWDRREVAAQVSMVVGEALSAEDRAHAQALHLDLEPVTLQQLVVHALRGTTAADSEGAIS
jgi:ABC-2 type transport system ATP-binding protein